MTPDYRSSILAIPTLRFTIFRLVSMTFVFDFPFQYNFGTRPFIMDTLAEMPEAENACACPSSRDYTRATPPVRAHELTP